MPLIINDSAVASVASVGPGGKPATEPGGIRHLAFPFAFQTGSDSSVSVATVEQDTVDEVAACVGVIVACPIGFRDELPPFGVHRPEFAQAPVDTAGLVQQIRRWEQRLDATAAEFADPSSDAWRHIQLLIGTGT